jgi:hypothetical protein
MLGAYFSPLAPAAILLLGAFILPIVIPRLPAHWRVQQSLRSFVAPGLVGLAFLALLGIRLTLNPDNLGQGLELISGWNFATTGSTAALMIRADTLSLPFLVAILLALLIVILLRAVPPASALSPVAPGDHAPDEEGWSAKLRQLLSQSDKLLFTGPAYWLQIAGWLMMGAAACFLFISANGLTLMYAIMAFDICTALYWIGRGNRDIGVARLFLGIFTSISLMIATLLITNGGMLLFGVALWLRLGLYPFIEARARQLWLSDEWLIYRCLTLAAGIYLAARMIDRPLPLFIQGLTLLLMLLSGLLAWSTGTDKHSSEAVENVSVAGTNGPCAALLTWLILTESLLLLLVGPVPIGLATASVLAQVLSMVALWVTPPLGKPRFGEGAWSWPYLPALMATFTLLGLPFLLGWHVRVSIYQALLASGRGMIIFAVILAESLALSSLVTYWLILSRGTELNFRRSVASILAMVPFLTPGLGPLILSAMINTDLSLFSIEGSLAVIGMMIVLVLAAAGLGYFRSRLTLASEILPRWLRLERTFYDMERLLDGLSRSLLRVRVILEGQHYLGWAIFTALVGALVIIFS